MDEEKISSKMERPQIKFGPESETDKLARKAKDAPFLLLGLAGLAGVVGYGAYKYKYRGAMSTSIFLMQLRVAAQGTVVACLTVGLVYSMAKEYVFKSDNGKKQ